METQFAVEQQTILRALTVLWRKTLGRDVGPNDDFFDSGGDSLKAINMIMEVQSTHKVEIDVETFFEEPTLSKLTDAIITLSAAREQKTSKAGSS